MSIKELLDPNTPLSPQNDDAATRVLKAAVIGAENALAENMGFARREIQKAQAASGEKGQLR